MLHKAQRLILFSIILCFVSLKGIAQDLTKSPYSIIGVGEPYYFGSTYQWAMGQTAQGTRRQADINVMNPASYSALKYTVIDGAAYYSQGSLISKNASSDIDNFSFSYFMFGMPISVKRKAGLVFGLSPYSNLGYNVATNKNYGTYTGTTLMSGDGGLSRFHIGVGAQIIKNLSLGLNVNYLFGQTRLDQRLIIPEQYNMYNTAETRSRNIGDFQFQIGSQYHYDYESGLRKDKYSFIAGASYTMATKLAAVEEHYVRSLGIGGTVLNMDTIFYEQSNRGTVDLPFTFSGGVTWEKKDCWSLSADVNYTNWSSYRSFGYSDSLKNMLGFNIGASYIPNSSDYKNYFKRAEYRIGARYDNGNLRVRDNNISSYGISAGVGLPMGKSKSRINISGEYYVKGTTNNNLLKEEYFRIIFGINFTDRWFQRTKYE
jgi:long-subunit fatty acid transport protein